MKRTEKTKKNGSASAAYEVPTGAPAEGRRKKRLSVKWKLILLLVLMNIVTLVLIWLGQTFFIDKIYIKIKTSELDSGASSLLAASTDEERASLCEKLAESGICAAAYRFDESAGPAALSEICSFRSRPNCSCFIHRRLDGRGGLTPPGMTDGTPEGQPDASVDLFRHSPEIIAYIKSAESAGGACYVSGDERSAKAFSDGQELAKVVLGTDGAGATAAYFLSTAIVPLASTVKTLNWILIFVSIGLVVISILFGLAIALWITEPIAGINKSAKKLAECDYGVRFNAKGYREIEELSDTLNYAASELSKVDTLQKELIANISHDLRTPLTLISGYAEVMRDLPDENTEQNLQIIIDESNRMKTLVNDVLDISKIRSGTAPFVMETVQLTNCIESELTRYNKLRDREGYNIEFRYDSLVTVKGDYSRLMQVVYNLVNNAVTYTGEDKKVTVSQIVENGKVRILVKDTGKGIAPEELPLIWDRYYKVDKTHKRAQIGTGLGLSIVKGVVKAHGGTCGVESTPGEGSTFWFELTALSVVPLEKGDDLPPS